MPSRPLAAQCRRETSTTMPNPIRPIPGASRRSASGKSKPLALAPMTRGLSQRTKFAVNGIPSSPKENGTDVRRARMLSLLAVLVAAGLLLCCSGRPERVGDKRNINGAQMAQQDNCKLVVQCEIKEAKTLV